MEGLLGVYVILAGIVAAGAKGRGDPPSAGSFSLCCSRRSWP